MARASIAAVSAGLQSVSTACLAALIALALLSTGPAETPGDRPGAASVASAAATALFPVVALLLTAVAFVLVLTPMTKHA